MFGINSKMKLLIQGVSIILVCASMVLCDKMSLTKDMRLIFARVVN